MNLQHVTCYLKTSWRSSAELCSNRCPFKTDLFITDPLRMGLCYEGGQLWKWSVMNESLMNWSVMKVTCFEHVCYKRGLFRAVGLFFERKPQQSYSNLTMLAFRWLLPFVFTYRYVAETKSRNGLDIENDMKLVFINTSSIVSRRIARCSSVVPWIYMYVLFVLHKIINTVNLTCEMIVFFILLVIWTYLELQVMAGAERLCKILEWGREIKKIRNHRSNVNKQMMPNTSWLIKILWKTQIIQCTEEGSEYIDVGDGKFCDKIISVSGKFSAKKG